MFADRNAYLADPDHFAVPLAGLLSDGFAGERRALIHPTQARRAPSRPGIPIPTTRPDKRADRMCERDPKTNFMSAEAIDFLPASLRHRAQAVNAFRAGRAVRYFDNVEEDR